MLECLKQNMTEAAESHPEIDAAKIPEMIETFDGFIDKVVEMKDAEIVLRELKNNPDRYFNVVIKL